jgi:hypothetical protein
MCGFVEYEVEPGSNVAQGLPRQRLAVLSPIWRGSALTLKYPDGEIHTLVGWSGSAPGGPCDLQVFWIRQEPRGPADAAAQGLPFLALADSMIPAAVRAIIGPPPEPESKPPLLLR